MNKHKPPKLASVQSVYLCKKKAFAKALILQQNKTTNTHTTSNTLDLQNPTQRSDLKYVNLVSIFFSVADFSCLLTETALSIWVPQHRVARDKSPEHYQT